MYSRNSVAFLSAHLREIIFTKFINRNEMQQDDLQDKSDRYSSTGESTCTGINGHSHITGNLKYSINIATCNLDVDYILCAIFRPHQILHSSEQWLYCSFADASAANLVWYCASNNKCSLRMSDVARIAIEFVAISFYNARYTYKSSSAFVD
jgi:hypothetical protein